ncbi:MAG: archaellin/type IV pilin N-terminal domain-containing protein [Candidatus Aenigmatarchaeota archaeon]
MSKNLRARKGISPLIAAVLLIAFTMTIAAILATWAQSFGEERLEEAGERGAGAVECPNLRLDIESAYFEDGNITNAIVWNRAQDTIGPLQFMVYSDGTPYTFDEVYNGGDEINISSGNFKQLDAGTADNPEDDDDFEDNIERLEVHAEWERCPDVQPIDRCVGYEDGEFDC